MATFFQGRIKDNSPDEDQGGQMSFLEHLDELRTRLVRSFIFIFVAFIFCWFLSNHIYNFLARPVQKALAEAQQRDVGIAGITGQEAAGQLANMKENETARFIFSETTKMGPGVIPPGTTVLAKALKDSQGSIALYTDEPLIAGTTIIPKGVRLPIDRSGPLGGIDDKLIVTTAIEPFSLYLKVSIYAAIGLAIPFLLWQIWGFISPGLFPHERGYALPFIFLSSISFLIGAIFAYYIIFPPAARYLLGLGQDFRLLLKADDYFDFIILVMLAMGIVFQMPAITYVLARIGLVTAGYLVRVWRVSLIVILIAAAVLSPTNDVPNMLLFAAPMIVLYVISIFIAWIFGKERTSKARV
jgi:sec-independent protein translocase protein TatC